MRQTRSKTLRENSGANRVSNPESESKNAKDLNISLQQSATSNKGTPKQNMQGSGQKESPKSGSKGKAKIQAKPQHDQSPMQIEVPTSEQNSPKPGLRRSARNAKAAGIITLEPIRQSSNQDQTTQLLAQDQEKPRLSQSPREIDSKVRNESE